MAFQVGTRRAVLPGVVSAIVLTTTGMAATANAGPTAALPIGLSCLALASLLAVALPQTRPETIATWATALALAAAAAAPTADLMTHVTLIRAPGDPGHEYSFLVPPSLGVAFAWLLPPASVVVRRAMRRVPPSALIAVCATILLGAVVYVGAQRGAERPGPWEALPATRPVLTVDPLAQRIELPDGTTLVRRVDAGGCTLAFDGRDAASPRFWACDRIWLAELPRVWLILPPDVDGVAPYWKDGDAIDRTSLRSTSLAPGDLGVLLGAPASWSYGALAMLAVALLVALACASTLRRLARLAKYRRAHVDEAGIAQMDGAPVRTSLPPGPALVDVAPADPTYREEAPAARDAVTGDPDATRAALEERAKMLAVLAAAIALAAALPLRACAVADLSVWMPWRG